MSAARAGVTGIGSSAQAFDNEDERAINHERGGGILSGGRRSSRGTAMAAHKSVVVGAVSSGGDRGSDAASGMCGDGTATAQWQQAQELQQHQHQSGAAARLAAASSGRFGGNVVLVAGAVAAVQ